MIQDATLRRLQTLAESTQRISDDSKARAIEIDWRSISGCVAKTGGGLVKVAIVRLCI